MSLILAHSFPLEADIAKKRRSGTSDQNFNAIVVSETRTRTDIALPDMPLTTQNFLDMTLFEFNRDEKLCRIVEHWISCDKKITFWVNAEEQRCIQSERVLPHIMYDAMLFGPILNLKSMLVAGPIPRLLRIRKESVSNYAKPLAKWSLECYSERRFRGRRRTNDLASRGPQREQHEIQERLSVPRLYFIDSHLRR